MPHKITLNCVACLIAASWCVVPTSAETTPQYEQLVQQDKPVAWWRFDGDEQQRLANSADPALSANLTGAADFAVPGPQPPFYPGMPPGNAAVRPGGPGSIIRVADPGSDSDLDFDLGDAITIEAWVRPEQIVENAQVYIVGKGRTRNPGVAAENQNYALRLRGIGGTARLSFLFRNSNNKSRDDFHRWNSSVGFLPDRNWHHVAVTYQFGRPASMRGYLDGKPVAGTWDIGGATKLGPVVDNDELWIGTSAGASAGSTFRGEIDEVAIYRTALSAERFALRYRADLPKAAEFDASGLPEHAVQVELFEGVADGSWTTQLAPPTRTWAEPAFGVVGVPKKYTRKGQITDYTNPFMLRLAGRVDVAADGEYQVLLRAKSSSRLFVDGKLLTTLGFMQRNSSGHEAVPELAGAQHTTLVPLPMAHQEVIAKVSLKQGSHVIRLDTMIGGKRLRSETGEISVSLAARGEVFRLLAPHESHRAEMTDEGWYAYVADAQQRLVELDQTHRHEIAGDESQYWQRRHEYARRIADEWEVEQKGVDGFVDAHLASQKIEPAGLTDDYSFLRRVTIDLTGRIPTRAEIAEFVADSRPGSRSRVIDRLLQDPGWADNWVGYWQDVLAENPGILKPKLNNTGPFRWWIHESLLDNKPIDRFATELIMMEGSKYGGAPAGFAMATQNDVPMAAKAHVLATAFLGVELKCARCHDAPYHPYKQGELFSLASMLQRSAIKLPGTSTVPVAAGGRQPLVMITLKQGEAIAPQWPFAGIVSREPLPPELLRSPGDQRELLAAEMTSPHNKRFAQVIVNRLWKRYFGTGIVEPADDWHDTQAAQPELLDYLARELVVHGYDMKHVSRLILDSHAYQRQVTATDERHFAVPARRRMTAEQVVDSLFAASGKQFGSEPLTLDPEGRRSIDTFLNLGVPRRGWQFTSLSNERDRPALALPMAQTVLDVLVAFGWRDSRPNPLTARDDTPTILQPLTLANGVAANRVAQLSDCNVLTELALAADSPNDLVEQFFLQLFSRAPTTDERDMFAELLADGFDDRRVTAARNPVAWREASRSAVSWSNHLSAKATEIKMELERLARQGDPATRRLRAGWRERAEDVVWALVNSPEFVFLP